MAPIVLILGSGPRVGASVAATFASNGYSVVVTSRKGSNSTTPEGYLSLSADFNDPFSIPGIFDAVATKLNSAPSVVIYNAAALTPPPDQASVFSISAAKVAADLNVNTISAFVAAEQAVKGFEKLGEGVKKTFIYTGNILNVAVLPVPMMLNLGMGKAASAYWVGVADMTFASKGYRFFYADERSEDGKNKGMALDGPAHGEFYASLAEHPAGVPWDATFVKGKGHIQFK